jgi:glycosyltransferase involved in cell wall biosynthesis
MRITIVGGFFLPVPPVSGGSTEKSWYRLARLFAAQGHEVTMISRRWPGWPDEETVEGVRLLRLRGFDHRRKLGLNLLLDFLWSWRVFFALPRADIVIVNAVTLPAWLGLLRPSAGRVVLMTGRMPKGQYRRYRRIALVLAASSHVRDRVVAENPALAAVSQVKGYPIDSTQLGERVGTRPHYLPAPAEGQITLGFVGRIHEEKGLRLLVEALRLVAQTPGLPPWRLLLCGPSDIARGGSGAIFRGHLQHQLSGLLPPGDFHLLDPEFNERSLATVYQSLDIFCFPSLAEQGETFGVAVAEAMAAGAAPVVSNLACFTDFVRDGVNGLVFDHRAPDPAAALAAAIRRLMLDPALRRQLAAAGRETARRYDYATYAGALLEDFTRLTTPAPTPSSAP